MIEIKKYIYYLLNSIENCLDTNISIDWKKLHMDKLKQKYFIFKHIITIKWKCYVLWLYSKFLNKLINDNLNKYITINCDKNFYMLLKKFNYLF